MSAQVIDFGKSLRQRAGAREQEVMRLPVDELAARIKVARPEISMEACQMIARTWNKKAGHGPRRPDIPADDPVYALFDAYMAAKAVYKKRLAEIAKESRSTLKQTGARMAKLRFDRSRGSEPDDPAA